MTTIKSYTDLSQSKTLSKILPLESADMCYTLEDFVDEDTGDVFSIEKISFGHPSNTEIGCWSLAALLGVLPDELDIVKSIADTEDNKYMCTVGIKNDIIYTFGNNPVDACVEMIMRLNELKLL